MAVGPQVQIGKSPSFPLTPMSLTDLARKVLVNVPLHDKLLESLSQVQTASEELAQQNAFIAELRKQLADSEAEVERLHEKTQKERKAGETQRAPTRRFTQIFKGKKAKAKEAEEQKTQTRYVFDFLIRRHRSPL